MSKSRDAFRTISEVSDWLDTPAHVLRFWESKFSQIKPVKRAGGRRYYRPDDMALLSGIKYLLHEQGMTIKGAQKLLREQGVRHVAELGLTAPHRPEQMIEGEAADAAPVDEVAATVAAPSDPASWDPDDPWPADPAPMPADLDAEPAPEPPIPVEAAPPVMPPPPRRDAPLPFARERAEAADPPQSQPAAEVVPFGRPGQSAIPDLPDEFAIPGHPGALTALLGADTAVLRANAARIMPLAARLKVLADGIGRTPG